MTVPLLVARHQTTDLILLPALANRHGLITGATGTGKTISLQVLAERFSSIGVPVFMADVKGDLSGIAATGVESPKLAERLRALKVEDWGAGKMSCRFLGRLRRCGPPGARDHFRHGANPARPPPEPQRHPGRRAATGVQDC
jgi:MoxR-like ATPase